MGLVGSSEPADKDRLCRLYGRNCGLTPETPREHPQPSSRPVERPQGEEVAEAASSPTKTRVTSAPAYARAGAADALTKDFVKVLTALKVRFPTATHNEIHEIMSSVDGHGGQASRILANHNGHDDRVKSAEFKRLTRSQKDLDAALAEFEENLKTMSREAIMQETSKVLAVHHEEVPITEAQVFAANQIFQRFDLDKNGTMDREEVRAMLAATWYRPMDKVDDTEVDWIFLLADANGDGVLDAEELVEALHHFGRPSRPEDWEVGQNLGPEPLPEPAPGTQATRSPGARATPSPGANGRGTTPGANTKALGADITLPYKH